MSAIDVFDPDIYVRGVPHEAFARLRAEAPVYFHAEPDGRGFWAITRYEDVVAISKDPLRFSSARGGTNIKDYEGTDLSQIQLLMLNMDPPQHHKFRKLVSTGFTPRMTGRLEARTREITNRIIDRVIKKGRCDFVKDISAELPLQVIAELMGIPMDDRHKVFEWSNRLIGFDDPEFQTSMEDARIAATEIWMYANELASKRQGQRGEDLVSVLMNAEVDGERLTEMEFDAFFMLLAVAGNETTRNLISGGMIALMEHPEQRARLIADPALMPSAVEEMLRWVTPVMHFRRTVTRESEIRGQRIGEGDKVVVYYIAANRDEDVFSNASTFDVARDPNEHVAFGVGEHFCLGSSLARLEIKILFEEVLRRLPDMRVAGPVRRLRSNFISGYKEIVVEFTPE